MIHRFTVRNFKSLEQVSVDFGEVTVLVGRSGTGKTNFVTAMRFLRDFLYFGSDAASNYGNWGELRPATQQKCRMAFEVLFEVKGIGAAFNYRLTLHETSLQAPVHEEMLSLGDDVLFRQTPDRWESKPRLVSVPQAGQPAIGRIPSIPEVVVAYTALTSGIGCYDFPATVLRGPQGGEAGISGLHDDAGNYLEVLKQIVTSLHDLNVRKNITASLQRINPTISAVETGFNPGA